MIKFFKQKNKFNTGLTLIETLVAISIFTLSVLASMMVLSNNISNTVYTKKKLIASYLAQEGVEYIRSMRDTYMLYSSSGSAGWGSFNVKVAGNVYPLGNSVCASTNGCYFNPDNLSTYSGPMPITQIPISNCTSANCSNGPMYYDSATGKYNNSATGSPSGFTRKIKVTQMSTDETNVTSTVFWTQGSGTYSMVFSENLFNWIEQ